MLASGFRNFYPEAIKSRIKASVGVAFFGEAKKVTALRHERLVANNSPHSTAPSP